MSGSSGSQTVIFDQIGIRIGKREWEWDGLGWDGMEAFVEYWRLTVYHSQKQMNEDQVRLFSISLEICQMDPVRGIDRG